MKNFLDRLFPSLGTKVAVAVVTVLLLAGGTFVYFAQHTGYQMLDKQAQMKAHDVSESVKWIIEQVMTTGKSDLLQGALNSVIASTDIVDASVLTADGRIAFAARGGEGAKQFSLGRFNVRPGHDSETFLAVDERDSLYEYVLTPLPAKPECMKCHMDGNPIRGYLAMKIAVNDVRLAASQHRLTNIMMTVLTFGGLGMIIYVALALLVIKPIGRLRSHIRLVEEGIGVLKSGEKTEFPVLSESKSSDEIADLGRRFNNLIQRLNDANATVYNMHQLQLQQANRLASTGEIAASMAHEIKNPIAGVLGALQVFDGEIADGNPNKEILSEMKYQLERVNHAVNDLLSYARPAPPRFERVDLTTLVEKVVTLLRPQINGKAITMDHIVDSEGIIVEADRKQLQQVFWNVLYNAIQSIDSKGRVAIRSTIVDSSVRVEISDTGKGIPEDQFGLIFKAFFTTKHKGTGLGMTISKNIIDQHGGSIGVRSIVGKGTTIAIVIPLSRRYHETLHES